MNYTIKNATLEVEISTLGAELQSIKKDGTQYLWQGSEDSWKNKATNIFPYVGRMTDGKYTFKGNTYEMGGHGLIRYIEFVPAQISENKIIFKTESDENTLKSYPFKFELHIIYEIIENKLNISFQVFNKDSQTMYFGLGGHHGFFVPLEDGIEFEDYYLEFENACNPIKYNTAVADGLIRDNVAYALKNDKILNLEHNLFDNDALIFEYMDKTITLKSDKSNKKVVVNYPNMNYLAIWHTPSKKVPFVCIEPWTSLPSRYGITEDFENQPSLISLEANKSYINTWTVSIY
ncbi:MAG: aldose 1-epimerase family protein [Eubacteriales bacterium]|nr:aldose 1-epimerase family protein [Eubacteriales bacterium]